MGQTNNLHNESFQKDRSLFSFIKRNSHRVGYWSASVFTLNSQHRTAHPRLPKAWPRLAKHRPGKAGHAPARPARPRPASPAGPGCGQGRPDSGQPAQPDPGQAQPSEATSQTQASQAQAGQASQTQGRPGQPDMGQIPVVADPPLVPRAHIQTDPCQKRRWFMQRWGSGCKSSGQQDKAPLISTTLMPHVLCTYV